MKDHIFRNNDLIYHVLSFLANDGTSVARFALCSKELFNRIMRQECIDQNLWKELVYHRWKTTMHRPTIRSDAANKDENSCDKLSATISYRDLYIEKRGADAEVIRQLKRMACDLQRVLRLNETQEMMTVENPYLGQAWEHSSWQFLLRNRVDCSDILKATAKRSLGNASLSINDRLLGFLAARCVQDFCFADCLWEWKKLNENGIDELQPQTQATYLKSAYALEQYVFLVCEIQKTPLELILKDGDQCDYTSNKNPRASKFLDEISRICLDRINKELGANASITARLKVVNDVFVNKYGFSGNSNDYYNYRNVLLDHVLESKTGMPLTLCVAYSCVCRRLGIAVQLTGLPGHIVLGFNTDREETTTGGGRSFIDVFHECRMLSTDDCRQIVAAYGIGWREDFLMPLSTKMVLQRIFNNLRNCHEKAMVSSIPPMFCSDLMFQQHTLGMIHQYPQEMASVLLERLTQDLSIVLNPDLLRAYNLLSLEKLGMDPIPNPHARVLLELSSYAGLSFHNYA